MIVSTFSQLVKLQLLACSSYSLRKSSIGSPTCPEKYGARCEHGGGIAAGLELECVDNDWGMGGADGGIM